jgi:hypothetical protein
MTGDVMSEQSAVQDKQSDVQLAINVLREIAENDSEHTDLRLSAAKMLLDFCVAGR